MRTFVFSFFYSACMKRLERFRRRSREYVGQVHFRHYSYVSASRQGRYGTVGIGTFPSRDRVKTERIRRGNGAQSSKHDSSRGYERRATHKKIKQKRKLRSLRRKKDAKLFRNLVPKGLRSFFKMHNYRPLTHLRSLRRYSRPKACPKHIHSLFCYLEQERN